MALSLAPPITIRPIRGDDHERLRASHNRLSPESRYRRYLSAKPSLTNADVRYLVEVDGCDHYALVATVPRLPGDDRLDGDAGGAGEDAEAIVAVARYIRLPVNREVAEVAIVVGDDQQHHGLGTELVGRLADAAVARGVRRFRATMLSENLAVQRLFESLADGPAERRRLGGLVEMEFGLPGADHPGADCGVAA